MPDEPGPPSEGGMGGPPDADMGDNGASESDLTYEERVAHYARRLVEYIAGYETDEVDEDEEAAPAVNRVDIDDDAMQSHDYMGDNRVDVYATQGLPEPGSIGRIPIVSMDSVLLPGERLPLVMHCERERHVVLQSLHAPAPFTNLIGVVQPDGLLMPSTGTLAEIRQVGVEEPHTHVLTVGVGRFEGWGKDNDVKPLLGHECREVRVLPDREPARLPAGLMGRREAAGGGVWDWDEGGREVGNARGSEGSGQGESSRSGAFGWGGMGRWRGRSAWGCGHTPAWVWRLADPGRLTRRAVVACARMGRVDAAGCGALGSTLAAMSVTDASFYVASRIPINSYIKQTLLDCPDPVMRLRKEIGILSAEGDVGCGMCSATLASREDLLRFGRDTAGLFVNEHGHVHDLFLLKRVRRGALLTQGRPETAYSWFPGWAWQIVHCASCLAHLGWRFSAVREGLEPRRFYGMRRLSVSLQSNSGVNAAAHVDEFAVLEDPHQEDERDSEAS